ncbi:hypothetical protein J6V85_00775 [Candidatus Saccharibacteria bacterium]|nr:hypothetical protein [Candidatus Saccharibacteria bacterium]
MKTFRYAGLDFGFNKNRIYCLEPVILDIETSNNHAEDPHDLITWITSIQVIFAGKYYLFRYPEELIAFYRKLYKRLGLAPKDDYPCKYLLTYIHNASYDLSYLIPYINELPDDGRDYMGIIEAPNKFLTYCRGSFEFRCSFRLSGMSLDKWSKEMNIEHKKQIGLYDYDAIIYPDDVLDASSQKYDYFDVKALEENLIKQFLFHGDNILTTPLTATGYIRRELRRSCVRDKKYHRKYFYETRLDCELYKACYKAYAGGYTHNNRWYNDLLIQRGKTYEYLPGSGINIKVNRIRHRDFKSHYPSQMTCYPMPTGRPQEIYKNNMGFNFTIEDILNDMPDFYYIAVIRIYEAHIEDKGISMPFMQFSKCYESDLEYKKLDNGRILHIKGSFITYVDSYTLDILAKQYHMEYEILRAWRFTTSILPDCLISVIDKYFKGKSDKKNIVKALTEELGKLDPKTIYADFELMQDKKMLNSSYGCMAQNPLKDQIAIDELMNFYTKDIFITDEDITMGLEKYYSGRNNFLQYQIAGAITSAARHELFEYIEAIGYDRCLYADTDSIFYISDPEIEDRIERLNAEKHSKAHFVTLENGRREYYDAFEPEPDPIAFKGLHSKCYGIVTDKGLEITIAGVPARTLIGMKNGEPVYYTREMELAGIAPDPDNLDAIKDPIAALDKLDDDFAFEINTGVSALYIGANGYNTDRKPQVLNIDGHEIHTAGGCVIRKLKKKYIHNIDVADINDDNYMEFGSVEDAR